MQLTKWAGQVGASIVVNSVGYNGWAARSSAPMTVISTGGGVATCYKPKYGIAFLPLALTTAMVVGWVLFMLLTSALVGVSNFQRNYGGMSPSADATCPPDQRKDAWMVWQKYVSPHLEYFPKGGSLLMKDHSMTALTYLKALRRTS